MTETHAATEPCGSGRVAVRCNLGYTVALLHTVRLGQYPQLGSGHSVSHDVSPGSFDIGECGFSSGGEE